MSSQLTPIDLVKRLDEIDLIILHEQWVHNRKKYASDPTSLASIRAEVYAQMVWREIARRAGPLS